jgi:competence protein ComEC
LLLICLLKTPLRWSRLLLVALSIGLALRSPLPDVVGCRGRTRGRRARHERQTLFPSHWQRRVRLREWLAANTDGRDVTDHGLGEGITRDPTGCIGKLPDGRLVSYALAPEALEEDCRRAVVVVTTRAAPPDCATLVIGRELWRTRGARPENFDRPWAPRPSRTVSGANSDSETRPAAEHAVPRDATPKPEDLQADD